MYRIFCTYVFLLSLFWAFLVQLVLPLNWCHLHHVVSELLPPWRELLNLKFLSANSSFANWCTHIKWNFYCGPLWLVRQWLYQSFICLSELCNRVVFMNKSSSFTFLFYTAVSKANACSQGLPVCCYSSQVQSCKCSLIACRSWWLWLLSYTSASCCQLSQHLSVPTI